MATKKATPKKRVRYPRGKALARKVMNHILKHPTKWDQYNPGETGSHPCKTAQCYCGWARTLGGLHEMRADDATAKLLGIDYNEVNAVFDMNNTVDQLYAWTQAYLAGKPKSYRMKFELMPL
ncbi:hypothetical protein [Nitrospira sp. BLG_1]|uniref:hypothetical protein n=1 Tax=Nitrospira sp. BLG_1 TaxID=3395883 RepID=UPI0039BC7F33